MWVGLGDLKTFPLYCCRIGRFACECAVGWNEGYVRDEAEAEAENAGASSGMNIVRGNE